MESLHLRIRIVLRRQTIGRCAPRDTRQTPASQLTSRGRTCRLTTFKPCSFRLDSLNMKSDPASAPQWAFTSAVRSSRFTVGVWTCLIQERAFDS